MRHLLTGAGSGIGAAIARKLHQRGDELLLIARAPARAAELARTFPGASVVSADLSDADALEHLQVPDALDSLIHAAGVVELGTVADADFAEVRDQITVNLLAPIRLTQLCLPGLRANQGSVVFVNSTAGITANPGWGPYSASKFGLRAIADSLRAEEQSYGVRVASVFPGRTATPMQAKVHQGEGRAYDLTAWISPETVATQIVNVLDLPRDATVSEVVIRPV
ncbi:MAG TPA: SDR family oxidoreductase [Marmoricola sp.]|nr:SDR family oxidoreductase [Marmoricola sp.]HMY08862.1 SDR family oxidoreductase [Marmoricola sp.]